jgi:hypothetical protein
VSSPFKELFDTIDLDTFAAQPSLFEYRCLRVLHFVVGFVHWFRTFEAEQRYTQAVELQQYPIQGGLIRE